MGHGGAAGYRARQEITCSGEPRIKPTVPRYFTRSLCPRQRSVRL